ncbi:MAG: DUF1905 domain-containing protein [Clostridia bacterium]|nr:DUF1905 domain-containing protein [Clostridia bacterium]
MKYRFEGILQQSSNRTFIPIPFNVWDKLNQKGSIPCRVDILNNSFECKLVPKGNGVYWIPVSKNISKACLIGEAIFVEMEPIAALSRINSNSPYSAEHPVRVIDGILPIQTKPGFCGHGCVAMLAGVDIQEVIDLMGKEHASWSKIMEALDYYGISYAKKPVYPKGKNHTLPKCCIVNNDNSFWLWYNNSFCNENNLDHKKTVSFLEIYT